MARGRRVQALQWITWCLHLRVLRGSVSSRNCKSGGSAPERHRFPWNREKCPLQGGKGRTQGSLSGPNCAQAWEPPQPRLVPPGALDGRQDELRAKIAFGEAPSIHRARQIFQSFKWLFHVADRSGDLRAGARDVHTPFRVPPPLRTALPYLRLRAFCTAAAKVVEPTAIDGDAPLCFERATRIPMI